MVTLNSDLTVENDIRVFQDLFVSRNASITGTLSVGGDIVGSSTLTVNSNAVFNADVQIRGGDLTTNQTTFNLLTTNATSINIGPSTGTTTVNNNLTVTGDLTVNGTTTTLNTATLNVEDLNVTLALGAIIPAAANGAGLTVDGASATLLYASANDSWNFNKLLTAASLQDTPIGTVTRAGGNFTTLDANSTVGLSPANANVTVSPTGTGTVTISPAGALTINPTTASTINNTSIGATTPSTGKFLTLEVRDTTTAAFDLFFASNSSVALTGDRVLTFDVENANRTIALGGNIDIGGNLTTGGALTTANTFTTAGNFALTLTTTATTNATLPSGTTTLYGTGTGSITSSQLATSMSDETGSGALVFGTSPVIATPDITFKNAAIASGNQYNFDADTTTIASWISSFSATANLVISNLTAGRKVTVYVRNTNGTGRTLNVTASATTGGHVAVNMAGTTANAAGAASGTSVALVANTGTAVITVWNAGGSIVGMAV